MASWWSNTEIYILNRFFPNLITEDYFIQVKLQDTESLPLLSRFWV